MLRISKLGTTQSKSALRIRMFTKILSLGSLSSVTDCVSPFCLLKLCLANHQTHYFELFHESYILFYSVLLTTRFKEVSTTCAGMACLE